MTYPDPYYAQLSDLQARYGITNINIWADMDGNGPTTDAAEIAAQVKLSLQNADAWVNGFLRRSKYSHLIGTTGIVDSLGNIPIELTNAAVMYAGWWLLTARGVRDYDKDNKPLNHLFCDYQESEKRLMQIASGDHFLMDVAA